MAVLRKLSYVVVDDYDKEKEDNGAGRVCQHPPATYSFSYTLTDLQSMLHLAGCKANHAYKISRRVFDLLVNEHINSTLEASGKKNAAATARALSRESEKYFRNVKKSNIEISEDVDGVFSSKFDLYKRKVMAIVKREKFLGVICDSLTQYHYVGPSQRSDILLACRLREKRDSITILLCGTSGCGKSTLSELLLTSQRTLSRTASGRPARERKIYNRSLSLPVSKNHPAGLKKAKTFKMSLDVNVRTTNCFSVLLFINILRMVEPKSQAIETYGARSIWQGCE